MPRFTRPFFMHFMKRSSVFPKNKIKPSQKKKSSVGLALGGGAVWGIAHIGVLRALEDNNIPIDYISGTSIGSMVGGLYAAGVPIHKLRELAIHTQWKHLAHLSIPLSGLLSNEPMEEFISSIIGNKSFSDLKIPFAAVATDLITGEEVILQSGKVSTAIRASTAIPGIFHPVHLNNRTLVDGGVVNNVPVSTVKKMGADIVIAVNLFPSLDNWIPRNTLEIILKSHLIMQNKVVLLETAQADVVITIDTKGFSPIDLNRAKELYNKGLIEGLSSMDVIKACIKKKR